MSLPAVIVPVFNAFEHVRDCLVALERTTRDAEILVIDDASSDERVLPLLRAWKANSRRHHLLVQTENHGFVHSANCGLTWAPGDVVLLNSDTEVTQGWLHALARCLASDNVIATATPWTNNGEIASFPGFCVANPPPDDPAAIAHVLQQSTPSYPEIPTAVGFCMAISRRAIEEAGLFDEATFGRGYGEENDFSMRVRAAGMRNVLCDDAYVVHHGGASFGPLGVAPDSSSMQRLLSRHPGYLELVTHFIREDPLAAHREALRQALQRAGVGMG